IQRNISSLYEYGRRFPSDEEINATISRQQTNFLGVRLAGRRIRLNKMIGIVGGVGPLAGLDIFKKIIEETIATKDQEHLPVILSSKPHRIADRTAFLLQNSNENPGYALLKIIEELDNSGAEVVA